MTAPCKNCSSRCIGCHATCKEYKEFRKMLDKANEKRHKDAELVPSNIRGWHRDH